MIARLEKVEGKTVKSTTNDIIPQLDSHGVMHPSLLVANFTEMVEDFLLTGTDLAH